MIVKEIDTEAFGKCISLTSGKTTLTVTTQIGPRIVSLTYDGGDNILFYDKDDEVNKSNSLMDKNLEGKGDWHIYGGHRLWKSPEDINSYYPDNAPVKVEKLGDAIRFSSEYEPSTGLIKSILISANEDGVFKIEHSFVNAGKVPTQPISLWPLTVLDGGATVKVPYDTSDTGLLPNRNLVLWSYNSISDPRLSVKDDSITVTFDSSKKPMKIGLFNTCGKAYAYNKGMLFTKSWEVEQGEYPDFSCNTEIYTSNLFTEIETLSPLKSIDVGQTATHIEYWTLAPQ